METKTILRWILIGVIAGGALVYTIVPRIDPSEHQSQIEELEASLLGLEEQKNDLKVQLSGLQAQISGLQSSLAHALRTQNQGNLSITIYGYHNQENDIFSWLDLFPFEYVLFFNENDITEEVGTLLGMNISNEIVFDRNLNYACFITPIFKPILTIRQGTVIESDYLPGLIAHEYGHFLTVANVTVAMREEVNWEGITNKDEVESIVQIRIDEYFANKHAYENYPEYLLNKSRYYFGTSELQSKWAVDHENESFWKLKAFHQYFSLECVVREPLENIFEDNTLPDSFWTHISELRKLELKCTKEDLVSAIRLGFYPFGRDILFG